MYTRHPLLFLNRLPLLPTIPLFFHKHHPLFGLISSVLISIKTCAYVLLSWYALRPPTRFYFLTGPPCYLLCFLFHKHHRLFGFILSLLLSYIDLCLCTSFIFFLGTHCREPPHPLLFFHRLPLLPTVLPFVHKHHFLGFIFSFFFFSKYPSRLVPMCFFLDLLVLTCNISIETCAYVLPLLVRIAGGGAAPSPLHPPTRFYF